MSMNASEATANFGRAKQLFGAGLYSDSMRLLADLDREFPNTRNILLAMAACLEKLDCPGEAEQICDRLLSLGPDPRAAEIKARINAARSASDVSSIYAPIDLDIPLRTGAQHPPAAVAGSTDRRRWFLVGGVVLVAVLLLSIPLFMRRQQSSVPVAGQQAQSAVAGQAQNEQGGAPVETAPALPRGAVWLLAYLLAYGTSVLVFYICLMVTGRLRDESFGANLQDVAVTMLIVYLWSLIPLVGWIMGLIHFMRHYELTCLEMVGMVLVAGILQSLILMFLIFPLLFGAGYAAMNTAL